MNNKGFAVTTLIYGLAIMMLLLIAIIMAILSSMRRNMKDLSDQIENELLVLSNGTVEYTGYSSHYDDFYTVPDGGEGFYRIEVWSAPGMSNLGNYQNGYYASGIIKLTSNQQLYIYRGPYEYKRASYISALKRDNPYVYTDEYGGSINQNNRILYTDTESGWMIGSSDGYNRLFTLDKSSINGHTFNHFIIDNSIRQFYTDPLIIPYVGTNSYGKVVIRKILTKNEYDYDKPYNERYWGNGVEIRIRVTDENPSSGDNYAGDCKGYYTYSYNTSCAVLGSNSIDDDEGCDKAHYNPSTDSYTLIDMYNHSNSYLYQYDSISIKCPEEKKYDDLNFKVMISNGYQKEGTVDSKNHLTTVYDGKYRNNNGMGIQMSQYQLDSIVDKPDHGNFYILAADDNRYALTTRNDGISVGMELLGERETQRWGIDKVCNYNLNTHECVSTKPDGTIVDKVYRIVELTTYNALDIKLDENIEGNEITAQYNYNALSLNEPQLWRLIPNRDGTYSLKTVVSPQNSSDIDKLGFISYDEELTKSSKNDSHRSFDLTIGKKDEENKIKSNQKFRLFSYDYSIKDD